MTTLFIERIDPMAWSSPHLFYWSLKDDVIPYATDLCIACVGTIELGGRYDWGTEREQVFRRILPDLLAAIESIGAPDEALFLWAEGPMEQNCLPEVIPYVIGEGGHGRNRYHRYHIAEVTATSKDGYWTSWVSFEFCKESFKKLMSRLDIDFEYTVLSGLLLPQEHVLEAIVQEPRRCVSPRCTLSWSALAVGLYRHFEGCYLVGPKAKVESALTAIRCQIEGVSWKELPFKAVQ